MSKIQNEDIKSTVELASQGLTEDSLPHDDKVYITANSLNKTLKQAIIDGDLSGGSGEMRKSQYFTSNGTFTVPSNVYVVNGDVQTADIRTRRVEQRRQTQGLAAEVVPIAQVVVAVPED